MMSSHPLPYWWARSLERPNSINDTQYELWAVQNTQSSGSRGPAYCALWYIALSKWEVGAPDYDCCMMSSHPLPYWWARSLERPNITADTKYGLWAMWNTQSSGSSGPAYCALWSLALSKWELGASDYSRCTMWPGSLKRPKIIDDIKCIEDDSDGIMLANRSNASRWAILLNSLTPSSESCSDLADIRVTSCNYFSDITFYALIFYLTLLKSY